VRKYFVFIIVSLFLSGCICEKIEEKKKLEELPEVYFPSEEKTEESKIEITKEEKKEEEIVEKKKEEEVKEEKKEEEIVEKKKEEEVKEEKKEEGVVQKEEVEGIKEEKTEEKEEIVLLPKKVVFPKKEEKITGVPQPFFVNYLGECLIYELKWNFVNLGKAIIVCLEEKDRYRLVGITLPSGVPAQIGYGYNRVDSFIDKKTGKTSYFYIYSKTGDKEQITDLYFNWNANQYTCITKTYKNKNLLSTKREVINFDGEIFDCLGFFYFLRNGDINTFKNNQFPIALKEKWYLKINFKGKEVKKLPNGESKEVFILEPLARKEKESFKKGIIDIWITNDSEREPLFFEGRLPIGKAVMNLTKVIKLEQKSDINVNKVLNEIVSTL